MLLPLLVATAIPLRPTAARAATTRVMMMRRMSASCDVATTEDGPGHTEGEDGPHRAGDEPCSERPIEGRGGEEAVPGLVGRGRQVRTQCLGPSHGADELHDHAENDWCRDADSDTARPHREKYGE